MAERDDEHAIADAEDRDAILARRQRLIATALAGIAAGAIGANCGLLGDPQPCLSQCTNCGGEGIGGEGGEGGEGGGGEGGSGGKGAVGGAGGVGGGEGGAGGGAGGAEGGAGGK
jgi:hypothetical protein